MTFMKANCIKKGIISLMLAIAFFASASSLLFATKKSNSEDSASYVGKWVFHSITNITEDGEIQFLNAEELLNYIPNGPTDAIIEEMKMNQKLVVGSVVEISKDGYAYLLTPIPEYVTKEELDEAIATGAVTLRDGMLVIDKPVLWQDRDGELWIQVGMETLPDGEGQRPAWEKVEITNDGLLIIAMIRYQKA